MKNQDIVIGGCEIVNSRLKVLYLVNIPSPYRVSFFNELGKICELTVLFERKSSDEREANWHDYNFEHFKGIFLKGIKFKKNQVISLNFLKHLKSKRFDQIVVGGYATPTAALFISYLRFRRVPFVLNIDGGMVKTKESPITKSIKTYFISNASAWLSTGKVASSYLEFYGAKSEGIYIYPFTTLRKEDLLVGVMEQTQKMELRNELGLQGDNIVLTIGQFIHRKGFDILIKACRSISPETSVYFIGGIPTDEYIYLKETLQLNNVYFLGFKSKDEILKYYRASDLFVLPTREDIWGLVINEAISSGLPVITTDKCVAGLELVKDGVNGYIVPVDDENQLAYRIKTLLSDENLMNQMAQNSLATAQEYTIENMAKRTLEVLKQLHKDYI